MKQDKKRLSENKIIKIIALFAAALFIFIALAIQTDAALPLYNTTNLTNANNIYDQAIAINEILGNNLIGYGIQLVLIIITFTVVAANTNDTLTAFGAAAFIGALSATMLLPLKFIDFSGYKISLLLAGVSVALTLLIKR